MWTRLRCATRLAAARAVVALWGLGGLLTERSGQRRIVRDAATGHRLSPAGRPLLGDRGDVPGWVLVTLMTAGLVVVLWATAGSRLEALFNQAMDSVTGPGG